MDKSNRVTFKANRELVKVLRDLQIFYGLSTRSKLLKELVIESIFAIYKSPMPTGLSPEQKRAYRRIFKSVDEIGKELRKQQAKLDAAAKKKSKKPRRGK